MLAKPRDSQYIGCAVPGSVLAELMHPQQNAGTVKRGILDAVARAEKVRKGPCE